ncbi:MAG TPA: HYR domain-containing protein [Chryseosolibacter sp.]|nr:HYR domain-containing protein [Chryseosolibacter sp.]
MNRVVRLVYFFVLIFLMLAGSDTRAQSCDCPPSSECLPCVGGLVSLTFRYDGFLPGLVSAVDGSANVLMLPTLIATGGAFTVNSINPSEKFGGDRVILSIAGIPNATINTSCSAVPYINDQYGAFTIIAAASKQNGTLCCDASDVDADPPVFSNCPDDISLIVPDEQCSLQATWTEPNVSDHCDVDVTSNFSSGSMFPVGTTQVTYTATDTYGNTASCSFNVTIAETTVPVFNTCVSDIQVVADGGCDATATWTIPTASDNCTGVTMTSDSDPGDTFPLGETEVMYTAEDANGNQAFCAFVVTVVDDAAPVLTACPGNIEIDAGNACEVSVPWTAPNVTDCSSFIMTSTASPNDLFPVGTTTVTYTATDAEDNTSTCSFDVTVIESVPPIFTDCPTGEIHVVANQNCQSTATWTPPGATDDCSDVTIVSTHNPDDLFDFGETIVTYTATDESGNEAQCQFKVVVDDETAPIFTSCVSDIEVIADGGCDAVATWTIPTAADNCTAVIVTSDANTGDTFPLGATEVVYTAEDVDGNKAYCAFTVNVVDDSAPMLTNCPADIVIDAGNACEISVPWTAPNVTDCSLFTLTSTASSNDMFPVGTTTVIYTATDAEDNAATCSFDVTVTESVPPVFTDCPTEEIHVVANENCQSTATWTPPGAGDDCSDVTIVSTHNPDDLFDFGETIVTYTAIDESGNEAQCQFKVFVDDETPPTFTGCVPDIEVIADGNCTAVATWAIPTASDACTAVSVTSDVNPGDSFPLGETEVVYTAEDADGNRAYCTFFVNVVDESAPVLTACAGNIEIDAGNACEISVSWAPPNVTDCSSFTLAGTASPNDLFPVGTTTVKYTATDVDNNIATCSFDVIVTESIPPVFTDCPTEDIHVVGNENCQSTATWAPPGAGDNCSEATIVSTHNPGDLFDFGETIVIYTATDQSGNEVECQFKVIVEDKSVPIFSNCPTNIEVSADHDCLAIVNWQNPNVTDHCSSVDVLQSHQPGASFPIGITEVIYTATDNAGNTSVCTFEISVADNTPPVADQCPEDVIIMIGNGCSTSVDWDVPVFTDNCSDVTIESTANPGDVFEVGTTTVSYTARDEASNTTECAFTVTIKDNVPPVLENCPANIVITATDNCKTAVSWTPPNTTDNCNNVMLTGTHAPGDNFQFGSTVVVYEAIDVSGNKSSCSFEVKVVDDAPPVFTNCPSDITVDAVSGCAANVVWQDLSIEDNCGETTLESNYASGDKFEIGTTEVVYTALDVHGNTSTCSFLVHVKDEQGPIFDDCPDDIILYADNECTLAANWLPPGLTDNCEIASVESSHNPGESFDVGMTVVTYTATDVHGNTSNCSFEVHVVDETVPVIEGCPADIEIKTLNDGEIIEWQSPTALARCGTAELSSTHTPSTFFSIGETNVTYTAMNASGKSATCNFLIKILPQHIEFDIARIITPDGDGINDTWRLRGIEKFKNNSVTVIDRWGGLVFSATAYNNESVVWRGENKEGVVVPSGTYFYTITVEIARERTELKGFLEIIR